MSQRFAQNMRIILETQFVTLSDYESSSGIKYPRKTQLLCQNVVSCLSPGSYE